MANSTRNQSDIEYLLSIKSVRETNSFTLKALLENKLTNFDVDISKLDNVVKYVSETITSSYPTKESLLTIPVHGRYQHFEVGGNPRLTNLISEWSKSGLTDYEICKRTLDLFVVSVLIDAGAGNEWKFDENGTTFNRSEGIAVASFHMFVNGDFSNDESSPYQVNGLKLANYSPELLEKGFQITDNNKLYGFDGRLNLIRKIGNILESKKRIFGQDFRPGNMLDYLIALPTCEKISEIGYKLNLEDLWTTLMKGLHDIWPKDSTRTVVDGFSLGDAWKLKLNDSIVTFHKLTQWLTYSLLLPLRKFGHLEIYNTELLTGLPEYRNGGVFVDLGLLTLKEEAVQRGLELSKESKTDQGIPSFTAIDDVIVEWRSSTIVLLDYILPRVNDYLKITGTEYQLILPQLIEAGSWPSGRRIAASLRPKTSGPPINLISDGTVF
ncbi:BA75_02143T0 [Komagataella pastoris]|uniref:BA75_02143T0 n=1 Tax=Komagataella pastoris TaxID=4922 RepID=A0A1B2JB23_PICPA|nr:BA75_02143T0 [Komagataella pastoris]